MTTLDEWLTPRPVELRVCHSARACGEFPHLRVVPALLIVARASSKRHHRAPSRPRSFIRSCSFIILPAGGRHPSARWHISARPPFVRTWADLAVERVRRPRWRASANHLSVWLYVSGWAFDPFPFDIYTSRCVTALSRPAGRLVWPFALGEVLQVCQQKDKNTQEHFFFFGPSTHTDSTVRSTLPARQMLLFFSSFCCALLWLWKRNLTLSDFRFLSFYLNVMLIWKMIALC